MNFTQDHHDACVSFRFPCMNMTEVIGAYQQNYCFRINSVKFAMFKPPKQVACTIAFESEVNCVTITIKALPNGRKVLPGSSTASFPIFSD